MFETEAQYLARLGIQYEKTHKHLNFSCPICGEGNSPYKKRGFIYRGEDDKPFYKCYNDCGGMSMYNFLDAQDTNLAKEYYSETIKTKFKKRNKAKEVFNFDKVRSHLKLEPFDGKTITIEVKEKPIKLRLIDIKVSKQAKEYLKSRGFKIKDLEKEGIYYNKHMNALVFPLYIDNKRNHIYGVQIRQIDKKHFMNITFDDNFKYWGEDRVATLSKGSDIYVFESIFDALSSGVYHSIAMLGGDLTEEAEEHFKDYDLVFCFDNDEAGRAKTIKYAEKGYSCLAHSPKIPMKDFNEMLKAGIPKNKITDYIMKSIKLPKMSVLKAKLKHNYKLFDWS